MSRQTPLIPGLATPQASPFSRPIYPDAPPVATSIPPPTTEVLLPEQLDKEFSEMLSQAHDRLRNIHRQKDREIALRFIRQALSLDAPLISVKQDRNEFFRYVLKLLDVSTQESFYYVRREDDAVGATRKEEIEETRQFSDDRSTYYASKTIPGVGMLVYMAVNDDPDRMWRNYGFCDYDFGA